MSTRVEPQSQMTRGHGVGGGGTRIPVAVRSEPPAPPPLSSSSSPPSQPPPPASKSSPPASQQPPASKSSPPSLKPPPASKSSPPSSQPPPPASKSSPPSSQQPPASKASPPASKKPSPASKSSPPSSQQPPASKSSPPSSQQPPASKSSPPSSQPPPPASKSSPPSSQQPPASKSSPPSSQQPPASKSSPPSSQQPPASKSSTPPASKSSPPSSQQPPASKSSTPPASKSSPPSSQQPPASKSSPPSSKQPPVSKSPPPSEPPPPPSQPPPPSEPPPSQPPPPLPQLTAAPSKTPPEMSAKSEFQVLPSPQPSSVTPTTPTPSSQPSSVTLTPTPTASSSQPSPQQSSIHPPSHNTPSSSSSSPSSSSLLPTPIIKPIALTSPSEPERALVPRAHGRRRRGAKEESSLVEWTPEALAVSRAGPPPEDRLSGANTARPAATSMSLSVYTARTEAGGTRGEVMTVSHRVSLQPRVYREGMQYMRDRIAEILADLDYAQCQYYHTDHVDEDQFVDYLKACDKHFLRANTQLRKRSVQLEVIDSETRLVSLLNRLREDEDLDPGTVRYLTEYWENIKDTVSRLKAVVAKFEANVLNRLKRNYIGDSSGDSALEVCSSFTADISAHMSDLDRTLANAHILLKSFHSGLHQNLFDKSSFGDLIVVSCDLKAFPLLRLVGDVCGKVGFMCEVARQWLIRDEQFMQEIQSVIREARHRTKLRTEDLKSQKEKQKKYEKSVKAANILLRNNRDKLHRIETELHVLEEQLDESERDKRHHYDQLMQKESMVDFLQITLSQTKRNYNLQATRVKLSRQVKDLKELLTSMERDLDSIQGEIQVKAEEKVRLSEKVEHHEKSYDALRCDMDRFSSRVEQLQSEVTDLSGQLVQLEIIHNLKASPEKVEEIYDRPSTVKLAPSLKEKIKERKRKVKPK